jgi:amino acid adenylation domain-containing protein
VKNNPQHIALIKSEKTMTYGELNKQANRLAHFLIQTGIKPQDNIGLLVSRNFDMIVGMLAILKVGAAYVPIDPEYPVDRQLYIFNQSTLKMVIADNNYELKTHITEKYFVKIDEDRYTKFKDTNPNIKIKSNQLAYTIYTSGSTGRPKGVMIEHHSAVNLIEWVNNTFNVAADDRLLFITSMCFDLSVYDIFGMLSAGATLVIADQEEIRNVEALQQMLVHHKITFWDSVPTTLDFLIKNIEQENPQFSYTGLKTIFLSGDWIPVNLPQRIKSAFTKARVISLGGATEGTIWSNYYPITEIKKDWKSIPYGKPISNNFFYILNNQMQPVPVGVVGDLYIGGVGVARGYANEPQKTQAAFVRDIFNDKLGGMMYRTGDSGRMMPDMNIEFIGRKDNQVKINGFRVELGEIESALQLIEGVSNAIVLAKNDKEEKKHLIGYIVPQKIFDKDLMVANLRTKLPNYMIPAVWVIMKQFPLTTNGKIDRNSLPDNEEDDTAKPFLLPVTVTEKIMMGIWVSCMNITHLSTDNNFFELGGHSLIAIQILSKFEKETKKRFPLSVFFKFPTIQLLSEFIDKESDEFGYTSLVPIKSSGTKAPLYIIHGKGLHVLNFSHFASCFDNDQPIFGLQAIGLNGIDKTPDNIADIARVYINEIIHHNPKGPYILAGHSFGGYIAVEIHKQLTVMGKDIKLLAIMDTNVEKKVYTWHEPFPKRVKRYLMNLQTFVKNPVGATTYYLRKSRKNPDPVLAEQESKQFFQQTKHIDNQHKIAFQNYQLTPFNAVVHLIRANICVHFVNDKEFLGWKKYASRGVEVHEVPGNHNSMLLPPNVKYLAKVMQDLIDKVN